VFVKYNQNHDEIGRFTFGDGVGGDGDKEEKIQSTKKEIQDIVDSANPVQNINEFIGRFEERELVKKEKRKEKKEGLEKFVGESDERRESV
jgi:hypothetical protein